MSKKEKATEQEEKIVTRYDRKLQKRKEQQEKEEREKKIGIAIGIVVVVLLAAFVASFPIRTYMAVNETYVTVGGDKVTRVEFDYNYNLAKNNYMNQYGSYMSYFGVDMTGDLSRQMYSETLTWQDYFEQMAVENIVNSKSLLRDARSAGFTYDTAEDWKEYEDSMKELAQTEGVALNKYVKQNFGAYATMSRLSKFIKNDMLVNAYYDKLAEDKAPSDEEISNYYNENTADYDSVDYRVTEVKAVLPTEPTELADPQTDTPEEGTDASADGAGGTDGTAAEETYQPSEAEIAAAMKEAKAEADEKVKTVAASGELQENVKKSQATGVLRDWLFDDTRKAGDTTVIEDTNTNKYYVLAFEKRYLDETPSVNVRVIMAGDTDAQTILDEWKNGEATEESFMALNEKYSEDEAGKSNGGLLEGVLPSGMDEALSGWLFDAGRKAGDTTAVTLEDGYNYVMYFVSQGEPEWKLTIKSTLLSDIMSEYLEQISESITVEDKGGKLNYLKVQAIEEAESSAADQSTDQTGEPGGASTEATDETGGASTEAAGEPGGASTEAAGETGGASTEAAGETGGASSESAGESGAGESSAAE